MGRGSDKLKWLVYIVLVGTIFFCGCSLLKHVVATSYSEISGDKITPQDVSTGHYLWLLLQIIFGGVGFYFFRKTTLLKKIISSVIEGVEVYCQKNPTAKKVKEVIQTIADEKKVEKHLHKLVDKYAKKLGEKKEEKDGKEKVDSEGS